MVQRDDHQEILEFTKHLGGSIACLRMYFFDHPQVELHTDRSYGELSHLLGSKPEVTFILVDDRLVYRNRAVKSDIPQVSTLARSMKENGVESITFLAGLSKKDLQQLVRDLASPNTTFIRGGTYIKLGRVELPEAQKKGEEDLEMLHEADEKVVDLSVSFETNPPNSLSLGDAGIDPLKECCKEIRDNKTVDMEHIRDIVGTLVRGLARGGNTFRMLASLRAADEYTFTHVINVSILTMSQAMRLGFKGKHLFEIGIAGLLHDVGKLFIHEEILKKPGKLSPLERSVMNTHSLKGFKYLLGVATVPALALMVALEHHITYDGTGGYPAMKEKRQPHIVSRMVAIADLFDAMRSNRPYQEPKSEAVIISVLKKQRGKTYEPYLVDNFLELIELEGSDFTYWA